jgi:hypothetical protein
MLFELVFEVATRRFGLVGSTFRKLSAWLPVVALTFTTASKQAIGVNNRSLGFTGPSLGNMHFLVPSGTSIAPGVRASICGDVAVVRKAKTAASTVR